MAFLFFPPHSLHPCQETKSGDGGRVRDQPSLVTVVVASDGLFNQDSYVHFISFQKGI